MSVNTFTQLSRCVLSLYPLCYGMITLGDGIHTAPPIIVFHSCFGLRAQNTQIYVYLNKIFVSPLIFSSAGGVYLLCCVEASEAVGDPG